MLDATLRHADAMLYFAPALYVFDKALLLRYARLRDVCRCCFVALLICHTL